MNIHHLKCHPAPFCAIVRGEKHHEWRRDDRGFEVGDILNLQEFAISIYTGDTCEVKVTHITRGPDFEIPEGFVVMSIETLGVWESSAELRARLQEQYAIVFSRAALTKLLRNLNPPGVQIHFTKNGCKIDSIRVSPEFEKWLVSHVKRWRKKS